MNNAQLYKQFAFKVISHRSPHHTDNSAGIDLHFFARMRTGRGRIVMQNKKTLLVEAGDVFYLPMGLAYHSYWYPDPETGRVEWESYGFTVYPSLSEQGYGAQTVAVPEEGIALLDAMAQDLRVSPRSVGCLYLFLDRTLPLLREEAHKPKTRLLEKIRTYMEQNTEFSVSALARHCGMSESGLYAYVKRHTGVTPVELKNRIKAEQAVELLCSTDLSVEEISTRLGFSTAAYLRKLVKSHTGKTPQTIRRENRTM